MFLQSSWRDRGVEDSAVHDGRDRSRSIETLCNSLFPHLIFVSLNSRLQDKLWFVSQALLQDVLRVELESAYGCSVELGKELVSFEEDAEGVTVHIAVHVGNDTNDEHIRTPYVIGADGAKGWKAILPRCIPLIDALTRRHPKTTRHEFSR